MKTTERIIIYAALLLCIVFWNRSCEKNKEPKIKTITVEVPAKTGNFKIEKPTQKPINIDSIAQLVRDTIPEKTKIIKEASKSNDSLLKAYQDLESEFERFKLFQNFASVKEFNQEFDDERLFLDVSGVVRGEIESININTYKIKESSLETKFELPKPKKWHIGPYFGFDVINQDFSFGVSVNYSLFSF